MISSQVLRVDKELENLFKNMVFDSSNETTISEEISLIEPYVANHILDRIWSIMRFSGERFYAFDKNSKLVLKYEKGFKTREPSFERIKISFYFLPERCVRRLSFESLMTIDFDNETNSTDVECDKGEYEYSKQKYIEDTDNSVEEENSVNYDETDSNVDIKNICYFNNMMEMNEGM